MTTSRKKTIRDTMIIIVSAFFLGHLLVWMLPTVFDRWNSQVFDQMFLLRTNYFPSSNPYDNTIIHVSETDSSILEMSANTYISRRQYGKIVRNLGELGAAAQIWDYIFRAPGDPTEDAEFFADNAAAGNVYYGMALDLRTNPVAQKQPRPASHWRYLDSTKWDVQVKGDISKMYVGEYPILTFPEAAQHTRGLGYLSLKHDPDGVFRRAPLLVRYVDEARHINAFYPSFPFRAICEYLHVTPDRIILKPGTSITLKDAYRPGAQPHDIVIPVDERCNMIVNFVGPWGHMTDYKMVQIYRVSDDRDAMEMDWMPLFKGKIVVVNEASTGATDIQPVPVESYYPLGGLHANVMHTILTENFLQEANAAEKIGVEIILLLFLGFFAVKFSSKGLWIGSVGLFTGYIAIVLGAFLYGNLIINMVRPILITGFGLFAVIAYRFIGEEKQKEALRQSFEAYLPPTIVKRMLANPESVFAGQKKELTILFSDIKSFTTYSSIMSPDQIQKMLNEYFEAMVDVVFKYEGTVDKYIGDGLMVFFGAPEPQPDHALRCVKAAIDMQRKCRQLKAEWEKTGLFPLRIRIGVNTGPVVVGNMGSTRKLSYTVLGSDVNLANRLESNAPVEGIMISRRTWELVHDQIQTEPHEPVLVKGLDTPIEVYTVPVDETTAPSA